MNADEQRVYDSIKRNLRNYPPYKPEHLLFVRECSRGVSANYASGKREDNPTRFDIQFIDGVCYILGFVIQKELRRKGNGRRLLNVIEKIAQDECARKLQTTPSGEDKYKFFEKCGFSRINEWEWGKEI